MVRVKICGITTSEDAHHAVNVGADALGFVFFDRSPRHVAPADAREIIRTLPPFIQCVGLFVNEDIAVVNETAAFCGLDLIQLHGDETPDYCSLCCRRVLKAFRVRDELSLVKLPSYRVAGYLLDAWSPDRYGGTGETFNWELARRAGELGPIVLAGGLTPQNVRRAVEQVAPYAVDVSSGVESAPGRKDPLLVEAFIRSAKITVREESV